MLQRPPFPSLSQMVRLHRDNALALGQSGVDPIQEAADAMAFHPFAPVSSDLAITA